MVERSLSMREVRGSMPRFSKVAVLKRGLVLLVASEKQVFRPQRGFMKCRKAGSRAARGSPHSDDSKLTTFSPITGKLGAAGECWLCMSGAWGSILGFARENFFTSNVLLAHCARLELASGG